MQKTWAMVVGYLIVFIAFHVIFYSGNVYADGIIIARGKVLTGSIIKAENGALSFSTTYSEPMTNQTSKTPVEVDLTGREVPKHIPHTTADGQLMVELNEN